MKKYQTADFKIEIAPSVKAGQRDKVYVMINKDTGITEWESPFLVSILDLMISAQEDLDKLREILKPKKLKVLKLGGKGDE